LNIPFEGNMKYIIYRVRIHRWFCNLIGGDSVDRCVRQFENGLDLYPFLDQCRAGKLGDLYCIDKYLIRIITGITLYPQATCSRRYESRYRLGSSVKGIIVKMCSGYRLSNGRPGSLSILVLYPEILTSLHTHSFEIKFNFKTCRIRKIKYR